MGFRVFACFFVQKSFVISESCSDIRCIPSRASSVSVTAGAGEVLIHRGTKQAADVASDPNTCPNKHVSFNAKRFCERVVASSEEHQRKVNPKPKP